MLFSSRPEDRLTTAAPVQPPHTEDRSDTEDRPAESTPNAADDTAHLFTRHGREIMLRVRPIDPTGLGGHALVFGDIADDCLVRIHSRCLYGDALRSDDCDCGPELDVALDMIQLEGRGVLLYLEQEGRGAGLVGKARGYRTSQLEQIDTFASYERLGLNPDSRTYSDAAKLLKMLGLQSIRLLTNNPDKLEQVQDAGLHVQPVPLQITPRNRSVQLYLQAKRQRRGHTLPQRWWKHHTMRALLVVVPAFVLSGSCFVLAQIAGFGIRIAFGWAAVLLAGAAGGFWTAQGPKFLHARLRLLHSKASWIPDRFR